MNDWVGHLKILNTIEHFLLYKCIALPPIFANSAKKLGRVRPFSVFRRSCNGGILNSTLQISLLCRNQYLVVSSQSEYLVVHILEYQLLFWDISQCLPSMPGALSFCLVFSQSIQCFSIFLSVFHFARCLLFCSEFLVLVGAAKIMNINLRSRLDSTFLLGPTKTQNPNTHSQLHYRV